MADQQDDRYGQTQQDEDMDKDRENDTGMSDMDEGSDIDTAL